jgi:hypothetical protein
MGAFTHVPTGMGYSADGTVFQNLVNQGLPGKRFLSDLHNAPVLIIYRYSILLTKAVFGMWLTPKSVGGAELTLGGIDNSKFSGPITYIPVDPATQVGTIAHILCDQPKCTNLTVIGILAARLFAVCSEWQDLHRIEEDNPCYIR